MKNNKNYIEYAYYEVYYKTSANVFIYVHFKN